MSAIACISAPLLGFVHLSAWSLWLVTFSLAAQVASAYDASLIFLPISALLLLLSPLTVKLFSTGSPRPALGAAWPSGVLAALWLPCLVAVCASHLPWVVVACFVLACFGLGLYHAGAHWLCAQSPSADKVSLQCAQFAALSLALLTSVNFGVFSSKTASFFPMAALALSGPLLLGLTLRMAQQPFLFYTDPKPWVIAPTSRLLALANLLVFWLTVALLPAALFTNMPLVLAWLGGFVYAIWTYSTRDGRDLTLHGGFWSHLTFFAVLLAWGFPNPAMPQSCLSALLLMAFTGFCQALLGAPAACLFAYHPSGGVVTRAFTPVVSALFFGLACTLPASILGVALLLLSPLLAVWHYTQAPQLYFMHSFRFFLFTLQRHLFGLETVGIDNITQDNRPLVIVGNHASFLDVPILGSYFARKLVYPIFPWWMECFYIKLSNGLIADIYPTDSTNPSNMVSIVKAIKSGRTCLIFPEGRLSNNGNLMKIYEGSTLLIEHAQADVQAIVTDGGQRSKVARADDRSKARWFPKMTTAIGPARTIDCATLKGKAKRQYLVRQIYGQLTQAMLDARPRQTLGEALITAQHHYGKKRLALRHSDWTADATYHDLCQRAQRCAQHLRKHVAHDDLVGLWLPASIDFCSMLFGCFTRQAVAMPVDPQLSAATFSARMQRMRPKIVVTDSVRLQDPAYQEQRDTLKKLGITLVDCAHLSGRVAWRSRLCQHLSASLPARDPAAVPALLLVAEDDQAVVYSHHNLCQQAHQLSLVCDFLGRDTLYNQRGLFDIFGLCQGLLHPLLAAGVPVIVDRTNPKKPARMLESFYDTQATLLVSSHAFLTDTQNLADGYDTLRLRMVMIGSADVYPDCEILETWQARAKTYVYSAYCQDKTGILALNFSHYAHQASLGQLLPHTSFVTSEGTFAHPLAFEAEITALTGPQIPTWRYSVEQGFSQTDAEHGCYTPPPLDIDHLGYVFPAAL